MLPAPSQDAPPDLPARRQRLRPERGAARRVRHVVEKRDAEDVFEYMAEATNLIFDAEEWAILSEKSEAQNLKLFKCAAAMGSGTLRQPCTNAVRIASASTD